MSSARPPSPVDVLGLDHVVLRVADIEASLDWYRRVLGCTVERRIESFGLYQLRAGTNLIGPGPDREPGGQAGRRRAGTQAAQHGPFRAPSRRLRRDQASAANLKRRGVEPGAIARRYGACGHGPSLYLSDPDGNTVELKGPPDADQSERVEDAEYPARATRGSAGKRDARA